MAVENVMNHGAVENGLWDDGPAIAAAIAALPAGGGEVYFPQPPVTYRITGPIKGRSDVRFYGDHRGVGIQQDTWGKPVFDLLDVTNVDVENLHLFTRQPRVFLDKKQCRGDGEYAYGAGVWSNGSRIKIRHVAISGFYLGIYLSGHNTELSPGSKCDNQVVDVLVDRVDFGIVFARQERLVINRLRGSYAHLPDGLASHLIYATRDPESGKPSRNIVIRDCIAHDGEDQWAFQIKSVCGGTISGLRADNCPGLLSVGGCTDVIFTDISGTRDRALHGNGSIYVQAPYEPIGGNTRVILGGVLLTKVTDNRAICLDGSDCVLRNATIVTRRPTIAEDYEVTVGGGDRNRVESLRLTNEAAAIGGARGIGVTDGMGHRIRDIELLGVRGGVYLDPGVTDCLVDYVPRLIAPYGPLAPAPTPFYVAGTANAPGTSLIRRLTRIQLPVVRGGVTPDASQATQVTIRVTGPGVQIFPAAEGTAGAELLFELINDGADLLPGAIRFQPGYHLAGVVGTPAIAAGGRWFVRFCYDNGEWWETSRS